MSARILLLDDERDTREMLGRALQRAGYEALLASTAEQALAQLRAEPRVDLLVTDIVLGVEDWRGLRLLAEIRQAGMRIPVVVITAFADVEKVKFALNQGATHLLEKPFRASALTDVIGKLLGADASAEKPDVEQLFEKARLTDKERTVAHHLLAGLSSNEIAELEQNSPRTIRQHVSQIYAKCNVGSRAEIFRLAFAG